MSEIVWEIDDYWEGKGTVTQLTNSVTGEILSFCTCKDFLFKTDNCVHVRKVKLDIEKEERKKAKAARNKKDRKVKKNIKKKDEPKVPKYDDILQVKRSIRLPDE